MIRYLEVQCSAIKISIHQSPWPRASNRHICNHVTTHENLSSTLQEATLFHLQVTTTNVCPIQICGSSKGLVGSRCYLEVPCNYRSFSKIESIWRSLSLCFRQNFTTDTASCEYTCVRKSWTFSPRAKTWWKLQSLLSTKLVHLLLHQKWVNQSNSATYIHKSMFVSVAKRKIKQSFYWQTPNKTKQKARSFFVQGSFIHASISSLMPNSCRNTGNCT